MRKKTYEEVKLLFESEGWTLLDKEFINTKTPMSCICPAGHRTLKTYDSFRSGYRCDICAHVKLSRSRKLNTDDVYAHIRSEGYTPLSEYVDCKQHMQLRCPNGHVISTTYDNFKTGHRCPICQHQRQADEQRFTLDQVREIFRAGDCELLSTEYAGYHKPLQYRCSCGRVSKIAQADFRSGKRCAVCGREKMARSMASSGKVKSSTQQRLLHTILGGELNYAHKTSFQDIAFPNQKIYLEYDGSGHNLAVKKKAMTQEEFDARDMRRTYGLYHEGWHLMRIRSKRDKLPSESMIITMYEIAKMIFDDGHHYVVYDIDRRTIEYNQITYCFDFGEIKTIQPDQHGND